MQTHQFTTPLVMTTVSSLHKSMQILLAKTKALQLDLSLIKNVDSAGIAFLLELKSIAKRNGCKLDFIKTPGLIERFCKLYKVTL